MIYDLIRNKFLRIIYDNLPIYFMFCTLAFAFLTTFPVILDRSITLHMYNYLAKNPGVSEIEIRKNFIDEFLITNKGIEKRIREQEVLGNVSVIKNRVYLTKSGIHSYKLFNNLNKLFNIKPTY